MQNFFFGMLIAAAAYGWGVRDAAIEIATSCDTYKSSLIRERVYDCSLRVPKPDPNTPVAKPAPRAPTAADIPR